MPLTSELTLASSPRAAADARRWVGDICHRLERADLVECAELGVSELVANAIIHANAPFKVRVRGTASHPRIEVADGSTSPPVPPVPVVPPVPGPVMQTPFVHVPLHAWLQPPQWVLLVSVSTQPVPHIIWPATEQPQVPLVQAVAPLGHALQPPQCEIVLSPPFGMQALPHIN